MSDEVLVQALDSAPDAVLLFGPEGDVVYANDAAATIFERSLDDLCRQNIAELMLEDDHPAALASVAAFEVQGAQARTPATFRFLRPDGSWLTLDTSGNPVTTADGSTWYSSFSRRAEEQRIMADTIRTIAQGYDLVTVLELVAEQIRWAADHAVSVVVWEDEAGGRHRLGDAVPDGLCGLAPDGAVDDSPWTRAWTGEDGAGPVDELPPPLRDVATDAGLRAYRVHPVPDVHGRVRVVITLWQDERLHPLPVFENRLLFVSDLVQLTLRFDHQQQLLHHDAHHDPLTGLANRRAFFSDLQTASAVGQAASTAILYIDLDGFKPVNDQYGHGAGDLLLVEVAERLRSACRADDVVARLGGDEFAVACRGADAGDVALVAERFLALLSEPVDLDGVAVTIRASVGAAVGTPADAPRLALDADRALYEAKRAGGQRLVVATPPH